MARARASIMPEALETEALGILSKYGMTYQDSVFKKAKPEQATWTWNTHYQMTLIGSPAQLRGCCGVIEMHHLYPIPAARNFPVEATPEEWATLFQYNVRSVLRNKNRRVAVATTIASQKACVPLLRSAGFEVVSEGLNPGTRHKVTLWALSI